MLEIKQFTVNPFQENTYIVWDSGSRDAAIIDCGALFPEEERSIDAFVTEKSLNIRHIVNTHLHLDHSFGNAWASTRFGIKPVAAQADEFLIAHIRQHAVAFGLPADMVHEFRLGGYISDNDVITIGDIKMKVIATPGHTPGSVCLYCEADGVLFAGDTLFEESIGRTDLPGGSHTDLIRSIQERLMPLPDETKVMCGHGPATTIGHERQYNPFIIK